MKVHELKTWPPYFEDVLTGKKRFEFRHNDRGFHVGDTLKLREYDEDNLSWRGNGCFSGRELLAKVTYILGDRDQPFVLKADFVIMSIDNVRDVSLAQPSGSRC